MSADFDNSARADASNGFWLFPPRKLPQAVDLFQSVQNPTIRETA